MNVAITNFKSSAGVFDKDVERGRQRGVFDKDLERWGWLPHPKFIGSQPQSSLPPFHPTKTWFSPSESFRLLAPWGGGCAAPLIGLLTTNLAAAMQNVLSDTSNTGVEQLHSSPCITWQDGAQNAATARHRHHHHHHKHNHHLCKHQHHYHYSLKVAHSGTAGAC